MTLYLLKTGLKNDFYVVANDPTEAASRLIELLNRADYGFYHYRKVNNIRVIAEELVVHKWDRSQKPDFPEYDNVLILPGSCEEEKK